MKKREIEEKKITMDVRVEEGESETGGGSMPGTPIKTFVLAVRSATFSPDRLSHLLRQNEPPIITRIKENEVLLDMRTLLEGEEEILLDALKHIASS